MDVAPPPEEPVAITPFNREGSCREGVLAAFKGLHFPPRTKAATCRMQKEDQGTKSRLSSGTPDVNRDVGVNREEAENAEINCVIDAPIKDTRVPTHEGGGG